MIYEVEQKYRISSDVQVQQRLAELDVAWRETSQQCDQYFAHPARNFAETDEALRIRRVGENNFITYKGPKIDRTTKTRQELELPLPPGQPAAEQFGQLLAALGFRTVAEVRKQRRGGTLRWQDRGVEIAVDDVQHVGQFAELEIMAEPEEIEAAKACLASLAERLGLLQVERRSYLELLLASQDRSIQ